jgi:hypothetical protein
MSYKSIKGISGLGQLGILIGFVGVGLLVAGIVQFAVVVSLMPKGTSILTNPDAALKALSNPDHVNTARWLQAISTFILMFLPAMGYLLISHGRNMQWLGFNRHINTRQIVVGFGIILLAGFFSNLFVDISKQLLFYFPDWNARAHRLEKTYEEQVTIISNLKNVKEYVVALFIMALLPALFEEMLFRGALQNLLERWWKSPVAAIIVASLLFSLVHMSIYLFLSRAILGFVLGWMYYRSRNLWVNIIAHFINNAIALTALFLYTLKNGSVSVDALEQRPGKWIELGAGVLMVGLFILFDRYSAKNKVMAEAEETALVEQAKANWVFGPEHAR